MGAKKDKTKDVMASGSELFKALGRVILGLSAKEAARIRAAATPAQRKTAKTANVR